MTFDEDPVYIEMCKKAEEIQSNLPDIDDAKSFWISNTESKRSTWIPRLDQLIEMAIVDYNYNLISFLTDFIDWVDDCYGFGSMPFPSQIEKLEKWWQYINQFNSSLEQLILAYVMYNKYEKQWINNEWQVIS